MVQAIVFLPLLGAILAGLIALAGAHARNPSGDTVEHAHGHDGHGDHAHASHAHDDHGHGHDDHHAPAEPAAAGTGAAEFITTALLFVSGLAIALFITQGFSTAVYLSEELENPRRNVARTVLATLALSTVIILVPVVALTLGASDVAELTGGDLSAMVTAWSNSSVGA